MPKMLLLCTTKDGRTVSGIYGEDEARARQFHALLQPNCGAATVHAIEEDLK